MPVAAWRVQAEQHMEKPTIDIDKVRWVQLLFRTILKPLQPF